MATASFKGSFLGMMFNNQHSSDLNIVRISGGSRFQKDLLPPSRDTIINIPNSNGAYYFNSSYDSQLFNIDFAYDNLSEKNIREIRTWLSAEGINGLIFDEEPYKVYSVRATGQPKMSYICFDDADGNRIYKGEGSIQFQAHYPFAKSQFKELKDYSAYSNKDEWKVASGMKENLSTPTAYDNFVTSICTLYNPGDIKTPLDILEFFVVSNTSYQSIIYAINSIEKEKLVLDMSKLTTGAHYKINSKLKLIQGYDNNGGVYTLNNKIYNDAIVGGDFFDIEPTTLSQKLTASPVIGSKISVIRKNGFDVSYNYLYY